MGRAVLVRHGGGYTFEVTEAMGRSQVTVTLKSERIHGQDHYWVGQGANTYLYLRGGRNFTGWAIAENDDDYKNHPEGLWWMRHRGWRWSASAVDRVWLDPGTYTIEATTRRGPSPKITTNIYRMAWRIVP